MANLPKGGDAKPRVYGETPFLYDSRLPNYSSFLQMSSVQAIWTELFVLLQSFYPAAPIINRKGKPAERRGRKAKGLRRNAVSL